MRWVGDIRFLIEHPFVINVLPPETYFLKWDYDHISYPVLKKGYLSLGSKPNTKHLFQENKLEVLLKNKLFSTYVKKDFLKHGVKRHFKQSKWLDIPTHNHNLSLIFCFLHGHFSHVKQDNFLHIWIIMRCRWLG